MIRSYPAAALDRLEPHELGDLLEEGAIVHFPVSPVPFPPEPDLEFLRQEMPRHLTGKNISYHPEQDRVVGLGGGREVQSRTSTLLKEHSRHVRGFLERVLPGLTRGWTVATSSFRPLQERGRALSTHASNELVHVDAGAYGATHGNRILRFFMNAHPSESRVWITKGTFSEVYRRYGRAAGIAPPAGARRSLDEGAGQRIYSGVLQSAAAVGLPFARLVDTSPYDRLMRRFHNFMKDSPEFQASPEGHEEFSFGPGSAWMVFTDMVTHACISGQHAFIDTFIVPLDRCRHASWTPFALLQQAPP